MPHKQQRTPKNNPAKNGGLSNHVHRVLHNFYIRYNLIAQSSRAPAGGMVKKTISKLESAIGVSYSISLRAAVIIKL